MYKTFQKEPMCRESFAVIDVTGRGNSLPIIIEETNSKGKIFTSRVDNDDERYAGFSGNQDATVRLFHIIQRVV
jgi:hypothetical protein